MTPELKFNSYKNFDYNKVGHSKARDDFLGQILSIVNDQPVSKERMELIDNTIVLGLQLIKEDKVLDLTCGNEILLMRLSKKCSKLDGIDLSDFLVSVAQEYFQKLPKYKFSKDYIVNFLPYDPQYLKFNKVLSYCCISHMSQEATKELLNLLYTRYSNVSSVYIDKLPDYDKRHMFFTRIATCIEDLQKHTNSIFIKQSKEEFCAIFSECGYKPTIH